MREEMNKNRGNGGGGGGVDVGQNGKEIVSIGRLSRVKEDGGMCVQ